MSADSANRPGHFTFAFQPIVDVGLGQIVSQEALVRGPGGEPARSILAGVSADDRYELDEQMRIAAIRLASQLQGPKQVALNLNLMPHALELSPTALETTVDAAREMGVGPEAITIEVTENEIIGNIEHFSAIANEYRGVGLRYAIDDFGAGYAGLNLLAEFQPDAIKLDRQLVRGIEKRGPRQAIVRGLRRTCEDLGIDVIAEGVETEDEYWWLRGEGIEQFQGHLLAPPGFRQLPDAFIPSSPR